MPGTKKLSVVADDQDIGDDVAAVIFGCLAAILAVALMAGPLCDAWLKLLGY